MAVNAHRIPEVARRLGIDGPDVYRLIDAGELEARKGANGLVYVTDGVLSDYMRSRAAPRPDRAEGS